MDAIRYKIKITDSVLDMIHRSIYEIDEIAIPELSAFINHTGVYKHKDLNDRMSRVYDKYEFEINSNYVICLIKKSITFFSLQFQQF